MRVVLLARGTRGDVQPMAVLAAELRRRGHQVTLGCPPNLVGFAVQAGFDARPVAPDSQKVLQSPEGQALLASGNAKKLVAGFAKVTHDHLEQTHDGILNAVDGADLIVTGVLLAEHAGAVAEAKNVPLVLLHFAPLTRTSAYPAFPVTTRRLGSVLNGLTWALFDRIVWKANASDVNRIRGWLGLPAASSRLISRAETQSILQVQAFSATVVPGITDCGINRPIVGFLTPSEEDRHSFGEATPDTALNSWLSAAEPPAYFGFGSMPVRDPTACLQMIESVTRRIGLRALVSAGWSDFAQSTASQGQLRVVGAVNHDAVLPRCRVAIHHGGAGTTAASLTAGLPTLICSLFGDQLFWGAQIERLGVGAHLRFAELNAAKLERVLRQLLRPAVAERARALASAIRNEPNAVTYTADLLEARINRPIARLL